MVASVENVSVVMLASLSAWHIGIILLAVLILFGGKKLPELARGLGRGLRIFKEEVSGLKGNVTEAIEDEPKPISKTAEPAAKADKAAENKPAGTNQG